MNRFVFCSVLFAPLVTFAAADDGGTFFVSPAGRDDATGKQEAPFKTPARARDALRELKNKGGGKLASPVTVYFRGGMYFKLRGLFLVAVGNSGNAASRVEAFIYSQGAYAYGGYPDLDDLFLQQARERDPRKREALLHRIQQLTIERVMFAPVMDLRGLIGIGPRVADHTINTLPLVPFPAYEDVRLKTP